MDTFEQGWAARPFKEQFPELSNKDATHLDQLNHAVTNMLLADLITSTHAQAIRMKRFPRVVSRLVTLARKTPKEAK